MLNMAIVAGFCEIGSFVLVLLLVLEIRGNSGQSGRTSSPSLHTRQFEHENEDEHVHEQEE
jgi:hypothetical protein